MWKCPILSQLPSQCPLVALNINLNTLVVIWLLQATLVEEGVSFHCCCTCYPRFFSHHHQRNCEGRILTLPAWKTRGNASMNLYEPTSRSCNKEEVRYCIAFVNAYVLSRVALYFSFIKQFSLFSAYSTLNLCHSYCLTVAAATAA